MAYERIYKRNEHEMGRVTTLEPFSLIPSSTFEVFWRNEVHYQIKKGRGKERIYGSYNSKVHSIILTQKPRVSDGCLNDDLPSSENVKRERCMDGLCDPKAPSIALARNPRISDGCLNTRLIIGSHGVH
jgi:hypothetical protein